MPHLAPYSLGIVIGGALNGLLDLSQVEAGPMALGKEWTSLQEIIDAAVLAVRVLHGFETISVRDIEEAIRELSRSPAQALIVNVSPFEEMPALMDRLGDLPYGTPAMTCWVPGEDEAAK